MRFVNEQHVRSRLEGRRVAVVGSAPGVVDNPEGLIDGHDVVIRVNNYRLIGGTGRRTDVYYSFFGRSIRKTPAELRRDGVWLCMCKCPDAQPIESEWHRANGKMLGVDFRWIYRNRRDWWFCDTYVPSDARFLETFEMLGRHIPTTGFAAIIDVLRFGPASVFVTGFDFFRSGMHNVTDRWNEKNTDDPIGHVPEREREWLKENMGRYPITVDATLQKALSNA